MSDSPASVGIVVLAAGEARRFGRPKQLAELDERPILQHVLEAAATSGLQTILVVLGAEAERVRAAVRLPTGAEVVVNPDFALGQSGSLRAGLDALPSQVQRAVILLADEPTVSHAAIQALAVAAGGPILRSRYDDRLGHPIALDREVWHLIPRGVDEGARSLMAAHPDWVTEVRQIGQAPADVDTPADLAQLRSRFPVRPRGEGRH